MAASRFERIAQTIAGLKMPPDPGRPQRFPVEADGRTLAYLRPVPAVRRGVAAADARLMAEWRNHHKNAFFTWITATEEATSRWLTSVYAPNDTDIIFMLERPEGTAFGHVALYNFEREAPACEFGRILRGPERGPDGGMTHGCLAALRWATDRLGIERFVLEVFADNSRAIALYEKLGFERAATLPLRRTDHAGITRWEKIPASAMPAHAPDGYALRMERSAISANVLALRHDPRPAP